MCFLEMSPFSRDFLKDCFKLHVCVQYTYTVPGFEMVEHQYLFQIWQKIIPSLAEFYGKLLKQFLDNLNILCLSQN